MNRMPTYVMAVDPNRCSGCGVCADLLPEYFKDGGQAEFIEGGDHAPLHDDDVPIGDYLRANCPDKAVSLVPVSAPAMAI